MHVQIDVTPSQTRLFCLVLLWDYNFFFFFTSRMYSDTTRITKSTKTTPQDSLICCPLGSPARPKGQEVETSGRGGWCVRGRTAVLGRMWEWRAHERLKEALPPNKAGIGACRVPGRALEASVSTEQSKGPCRLCGIYIWVWGSNFSVDSTLCSKNEKKKKWGVYWKEIDKVVITCRYSYKKFQENKLKSE